MAEQCGKEGITITVPAEPETNLARLQQQINELEARVEALEEKG